MAASEARSAVRRGRDLRIAMAFFLGMQCVIVERGTAEWQILTDANGLPSNYISDVKHDSLGNIWIAAGQRGVTRYDGVRFTTFTTNEGLLHDQVNVIELDHHGRILCGTRAGVSRYDPRTNTWSSYSAKDGLTFDYVTKLTVDRRDGIWTAGLGGGVCHLDPQTERWQCAWDRSFEDVGALKVDSRGYVWVGMESGVARYSEDTGIWDEIPTYVPRVNDIEEDCRGRIWFATDFRLYRFEPRSNDWMEVDIPTNASDAANALCLDDDCGMWVAGFPLARFDFTHETWKSYEEAPVAAYSIVQDTQGNLWIGSQNAGIARFDGTEWSTLDLPQGILDQVEVVHESRSGWIWVGTSDGVGSYQPRTGEWRWYSAVGGQLLHDTVLAISEDSNGRLWFGTGEGASMHDPRTESWDLIPTIGDLTRYPIRTVLADRDGLVWFGTPDSGVVRVDPTSGASQRFTTRDSLPSNNIHALIQDRSGAVWVATEGGIRVYRQGQWSSVSPPGESSATTAVMQDRSGDYWIATRAGVARLRGDAWTWFAAGGHVGVGAVGFLEDHLGRIWIADISGVSWYSTESGRWARYTQFPGLGEVFPLVTSVEEDRAGRVFIGTLSGVSIHTPDRTPPRPVLLSHSSTPSGSRDILLNYLPAFGEDQVQFAFSVDNESATGWSDTGSFSRSSLSDGKHQVHTRIRDWAGNLSTAHWRVEIDGTPPVPLIESPVFGAIVRDSVRIVGTVRDDRFAHYRVELRDARTDQLLTALTPPTTTEVTSDTLETWWTGGWPDGPYRIAIVETDSLGLAGIAVTQVTLDNEAPWADETTPVRVLSRTGGSVHSLDGSCRVFFSVGAFAKDTRVVVQDSSIEGRNCYWVSWDNVLQKPAVLSMGLGDMPASETGIERLAPEGWIHRGGTLDQAGSRIEVTTMEAGAYSLGELGAVRPISSVALDVVPRILSTRAGLGPGRMAIGFALEGPGIITAGVWNTAGRLVRELASGALGSAGSNVLYWDGRDSSGHSLTPGLYALHVRAGDRSWTQTVVLVN